MESDQSPIHIKIETKQKPRSLTPLVGKPKLQLNEQPLNNDTTNKKEYKDSIIIQRKTLTPIRQRNNPQLSINQCEKIESNQHCITEVPQSILPNKPSVVTPFEFQDRINSFQKERMLSKIALREKMTQLAMKNMNNLSEKEKLIQLNEVAEQNLPYESGNNNANKMRVIQRYRIRNVHQLNTNNQSHKKNEEGESPDWFNRKNNKKNPYLPSTENYLNELTKQIEDKKLEKEQKRRSEIENERFFNQQNMKMIKFEDQQKNDYIQKLKNDFLAGNSVVTVTKIKHKKLNISDNNIKEGKAAKEIANQYQSVQTEINPSTKPLIDEDKIKNKESININHIKVTGKKRSLQPLVSNIF